MNTNSSQNTEQREVAPLLRSIARELVARTLAIAELDARIARHLSNPRSDRDELLSMTAVRANHRRELRLIDKELKRLGWRRDEETPMRFLWTDDDGVREYGWQLEGTDFYRSLDAPVREW